MSDDGETLNSARIVDVSFGGDNETIDRRTDSNVAVIVGAGGTAITGPSGFAYAGQGGAAHVERYGIGMCGNRGKVIGGAGCVLFAYSGGHAEGGDGSVAIARIAGDASCGTYGVASALDGNASSARPAAVAIARRQNRRGVTATVATGGVAIARDYVINPVSSGRARAHAATGAIAIAFEDNHLSGEIGALLVGTYRGKDGSTRFATTIVDGKGILPGKVYEVDRTGTFVAVS
jgi:hypothetical protein